MTPNTFTKWLSKWADFYDLEINSHKANEPDRRDRRNGVDYITITKS